MRLAELLQAIDAAPPTGLADAQVTGVSYDSRTIRPGNLFVAIGGFHVNGTRFIEGASKRGALAAVVSSKALAGVGSPSIPLVIVPDTRHALASLAAAWYQYPARRLCTIGITGTDGKTSTSYLTAAVLEAGGLKTGLFTTVAHKIGPQWEENASRQTTPEAPEVQHLLQRMADAGCTHAVLEATSHGLELHKLDNCQFDIAVLTNLSADHLDFHGTVDVYRQAKGKLFEMLDSAEGTGIEKTAILNADEPSSEYMASRTSARKLRYGIDEPTDIRATALAPAGDGTRMTLETPIGSAEIFLPVPGRFNVYNALASAAVGVVLGVSLDSIVAGLSTTGRVPGRMQPIDEGQPFMVVVDYAHTAASFEKVISTLRPLVSGRIISVFGCAGERGVERRTGMGEVAAHQTDYTVITTEDPRGEDPAAIIDQIAVAMVEHGAVESRDFERVTDRRGALARAFSLAQPGDLVLLTGKGHEHSIETASGPVPWDEARIARELLKRGGAPT